MEYDTWVFHAVDDMPSYGEFCPLVENDGGYEIVIGMTLLTSIADMVCRDEVKRIFSVDSLYEPVKVELVYSTSNDV